jgi:hypothetical protein
MVRVLPTDDRAAGLLARMMGEAELAEVAGDWAGWGAGERLRRVDGLLRWTGFGGGLAVLLDRVDECAELQAGAGQFLRAWCGPEPWTEARRFLFLPLTRSALLGSAAGFNQPAIRLDKVKVRPPGRLRKGVTPTARVLGRT